MNTLAYVFSLWALHGVLPEWLNKVTSKQTQILMHQQLNLAYKVYIKRMLSWYLAGLPVSRVEEDPHSYMCQGFPHPFQSAECEYQPTGWIKMVNRCFVGCLEFLLRQPLHTHKRHTALTRSIIFPTSCNLSSPYSWLLTSFLCIWIKYFRLAVLSFSLKKLLTSLSSSFNLSVRKKVHLNSFVVKISSSFFSKDINITAMIRLTTIAHWHRLFIICTCNQLDWIF